MCLTDKEVCQKAIRDSLSQFHKIKNDLNLHPIQTHRFGGTEKKKITLHSSVFKETHPSSSCSQISVQCLIIYLCACSSGAQHATSHTSIHNHNSARCYKHQESKYLTEIL